MQIDEKKLARQQLGVIRFKDNNFVGIFDWHTGVGKTFGAELVIKYIEKYIENGTYVIAVPSDALLKQWQAKLNQSLPKYLLQRIIIKTLYTLISESITYECGTLIVDEIHEFYTEDRQKILDRKSIVKCKRILGLTASTDDKNFKHILKYLPIVDIITKEEAEEQGFVASFVEYNLGLNLNEKELEHYQNFSITVSELMPKFNKDISLAQKVIAGGKDNYGKFWAGAGWAYSIARKNGWLRTLDISIPENKEIDDNWNPNIIINQARQLMTAVRVRREILFNCVSKYNTTLEIAKKFNQVKTIVFSESIEFADNIGKILNDNNQPTVVYHSKLKTIITTSPKSGKFLKIGPVRLKRLAIESINNGQARILATTKALDRGLDVQDLRCSVTTSGTQNPTQYKQRNNRSTRKEYGIFGDMPVLLINLYIKDTQDEKWLKARQINNTHIPIEVTSVNDINYYPPANKEFITHDN